MSLIEKASQLVTDAAAVPRLGIPAFRWWSEGIHGYMSDDHVGATLFPVPLAMGATWDTDLIHRVGVAISDEARAYYNRAIDQGDPPRAINMFAPNINIFRDPRWGRGSETYGEDPLLMGRMAVAYVTGLQGTHPTYTKVAATCKHYAAHSLEEAEGLTRHNFDAQVDARDLAETYLPAFKSCAMEAKAHSVMCSYNRVNGIPACANPHILQGVLREQWGYPGYVASDCGAVEEIANTQHYVPDIVTAAANATLAGVDLNCNGPADSVPTAVRTGLLPEDAVDVAAQRVMEARCRLGLLHHIPPEDMPWKDIGMEVVGSPAHKSLADEVAAKGSVLLTNKNNVLPLNPDTLSKVAVIGPLADSPEHQLGTYYGKPAGEVVTPLVALRRALGPERVEFVEGMHWVVDSNSDWIHGVTDRVRECCEVALVFVGSSSKYGIAHDEDGTITPVLETEGLDRVSLRLPGHQEDLIKAAARAGKPVVVVLINGGTIDVTPFRDFPNVMAVLTAWYPGQGVMGIVDVLLGKVSPSGRLPMTVYFNNYTDQVPETEMSMRKWPGRTYKYLQVPAAFEFGYGLSYTNFSYSALKASSCHPTQQGAAERKLLKQAGKAPEPSPGCVRLSFNVTNVGRMASDEVIMVFVRRPREHYKGTDLPPKSQLLTFKRVHLAIGESVGFSVEILAQHMAHGNEEGDLVLLPGPISLTVGPLSHDMLISKAWAAAAAAAAAASGAATARAGSRSSHGAAAAGGMPRAVADVSSWPQLKEVRRSKPQ